VEFERSDDAVLIRKGTIRKVTEGPSRGLRPIGGPIDRKAAFPAGRAVVQDRSRSVTETAPLLGFSIGAYAATADDVRGR